MDMKLIRKTIGMLRLQADSSASIRWNLEIGPLHRISRELHSYQISWTRKMVILGSYLLLQQAVRRHGELTANGHDALTKNILDGDYLIGMYFNLLVKYEETDFLLFLSPFIKRMQLDLLDGKPDKTLLKELSEQIRLYLRERCVKGCERDETA